MPTSVPSARRPWPLWLILLLFAAATVSVPMIVSPPSHTINQWHEPPVPAWPDNAADFALWLKARLPKCHMISPQADGVMEKSFYIAVEPSIDVDKFHGLPRRKEQVDSWKGVVFCSQCYFDPRQYDRSAQGQFGFIAPPFMFFGDQEVLEKIRRVFDD